MSRQAPFTAWFVEIDQMRGLNDTQGFAKGDALIHATAELLEEACEPGLDFVGHVSGSRFVVLSQSEDWETRANGLVEKFASVIEGNVPPEVLQRGYYIVKGREGRESVRPLPKLAVGVLPVLPGVFESRHEVVAAARHAAQLAIARTGSAVHVDRDHANAYPQSMLFGPS
jgi:GGDEF domain-containing protein